MNGWADPGRPTRWIAPIAAETRRNLARQLIGEAAEVRETPDPAAAVRAAEAGKIGLISVTWPGIAYPLWLRAGSGDAAELIATMRTGVAALDLPFLPRRIMLIGAGAGYLAVALAAAFPDAAIASIEPDPARARLHALNTLPWRQIIAVDVPAAGALPPAALPQILEGLGWDEADLLVLDLESCPVLDDPEAGAALVRVRRIAIPAPADFASTPAIAARFPSATHAIRAGSCHVLIDRRAPATPRLAGRLAVFDLAGATTGADLPAIASPEGGAAYAPIGDTGFRLRPGKAGAPATRLAVRHFAAGPVRFEATVRANQAASSPLRFVAGFIAAETGRVIHRAELVLGPGERRRWGFDLPMFFGDMRVEFSAECAPDGADAQAWVECLDPEFA